MCYWYQSQRVRRIIALYSAVIKKKIDVYLTTDILHEYEEKISEHWSVEVAKAVIRTLTELSSVH
jgi:uncharacterized protein